MKQKYPIKVIDIRHQVDYITPTEVQLFEEFFNDPVNVNARFFIILVRHRQNEMVSGGNKIIETKVI